MATTKKPKDTVSEFWQSNHPKKVDPTKPSSGSDQTNILTTKNPTTSKMPVMKKDKSGITNGVLLPNGDSFDNITAEKANQLAKEWNDKTQNPINTQSQEANIVEQQNQMATPAQAGIGTNQPLDLNNPITSSIEYNQRKQDVLQSVSLGTGITAPALLNIIPGVGKRVANVLGANNPKIKEFLQDYTNDDNFAHIKTNIQNTDDSIKAAKEMASDPMYTAEAIQIYNDAISQKRIAMAQLKMISDKDQKAYVADVKDRLTELQAYFDKGLKTNDDMDMLRAVQKSKMVQ